GILVLLHVADEVPAARAFATPRRRAIRRKRLLRVERLNVSDGGGRDQTQPPGELPDSPPADRKDDHDEEEARWKTLPAVGHGSLSQQVRGPRKDRENHTIDGRRDHKTVTSLTVFVTWSG